MKNFSRFAAFLAGCLIWANVVLASQATLVTPASPLSMTGLASFLNSAFLSIGSCNSGTSAPANGTGGTAFAGECWINTTANPWVFSYTADGTHWSEFGTLNTSTFVWTPYGSGAAALISSNNLNDVASASSAFANIVQPSTASALGGVKSLTCGSHQWFAALSTLGVFTCAQPAIGDVSGWGTGVATALGVNTGSAGAFVLFGGAGGTPSSLTLTNATGLPFAGLPAGTSDTVLGYWGSTVISAATLPNCSNSLTYSTSTHLWGCNTSAGTGTVTSVQLAQGAGISISTTSGANPCVSACDLTIAQSLTNATMQQSPSNPTSTTASSSSPVMMGLGKDQAGSGAHPCSITPVYSGRVHVEFYGEVESGTSGNTFGLKTMYGTGTAPSNGAAQTGTQIGSTRIPIQNTGADNMSWSNGGIVTGLATGTAVWFDESAGGNGTNAVVLLNVSCNAYEF